MLDGDIGLPVMRDGAAPGAYEVGVVAAAIESNAVRRLPGIDCVSCATGVQCQEDFRRVLCICNQLTVHRLNALQEQFVGRILIAPSPLAFHKTPTRPPTTNDRRKREASGFDRGPAPCSAITELV